MEAAPKLQLHPRVRCGTAISMTNRKYNTHLATAKECLAAQAAALNQMEQRIGKEFNQAVNAILHCKGRVAICGIGKSGAVGQKLAATLASTGTPAFFLHAAEAVHGDLGMLHKNDLAILLSYSGETEEIVRLIDSLKSIAAPLLCMTGSRQSTLALSSQVVLDVSVEREVCPHNLAPTTSTLAMMALGDALAVALIKAKDFGPKDFAMYHPGGSLGKLLRTNVSSLMLRPAPTIDVTTTFDKCLVSINKASVGSVVVCRRKKIVGIITDGDLRRALLRNKHTADLRAGDIMTRTPITLSPNTSLAEAKLCMHVNKIKTVIVSASPHGTPLGVVDLFAIPGAAQSM
jgi:arabinose-5-phosphate isomerase